MRGVRWLVSLSVLGAALVVGARPASAQASQTCTIAVTPVPFGIYDVFSTVPLNTTGSVTYSCGPQVDTITIWMSKGLGVTNNPRQMASGADRLNYYLCQDANCATLWGDQSYPTDYGPIALNRTNRTATLYVYGKILPGQDVPTGNYADTILVVIQF
jgi:spore coat protein U-like protein